MALNAWRTRFAIAPVMMVGEQAPRDRPGKPIKLKCLLARLRYRYQMYMALEEIRELPTTPTGSHLGRVSAEG
jgi:hypothetical protein